MRQKSITLTDESAKRLESLAVAWGVSESEVMRQVFKIGEFIIRETKENGRAIYLENEKGKMVQLVFA